MKLKEQPITCSCGVTGEEISELFEALQLVEPTLSQTSYMSSKALLKYSGLKAFLDTHCRSSQ